MQPLVGEVVESIINQELYYSCMVACLILRFMKIEEFKVDEQKKKDRSRFMKNKGISVKFIYAKNTYK